jgi:hypothetical protein
MKEFIIDLGSSMLRPDLTMTAIDAPIISALNLRKKKRKKEKKIYYLELVMNFFHRFERQFQRPLLYYNFQHDF